MKFFRKLALLAALVGSSISMSSWAGEIQGVKFPDRITIAGQSLTSNGAGVRRVAVVNVYVISLYLPATASTPEAVFSQKGPKRVFFQMLRDVSSDDLSKAMLDGIKKNTSPAEVQRMGMALVQLGQVFYDAKQFKRGDTVTSEWIPGKGFIMQINGKEVANLGTDEAVFRALLGIWLGPNPVDRALKTALLGGNKEAAPSTERVL